MESDSDDSTMTASSSSILPRRLPGEMFMLSIDGHEISNDSIPADPATKTSVQHNEREARNAGREQRCQLARDTTTAAAVAIGGN